MADWNDSDTKCMQRWIDFLEDYHIYFSSPLDIDFMMLEYYGEAYKNMLSSKEGPRYTDNSTGNKKQIFVKDVEKNDITSDFQRRLNDGVRTTLKDCGGDGETYSEEQKKLMIWYSYFFLQRGKPSTHIELVSKLTNEQLKKDMPPVISRLIQDAYDLLQGKHGEDD